MFMMRKNLFPIGKHRQLIAVLLIALIPALTSCAAVVGAGAGIGVAVVQERGIKVKAQDLRLEALVLEKFLNSGIKLTATIGVEVYEGRVMLTGATRDTKISDQAVKLAWQVEGVSEVINEIQVDKGTTATNFAQDVWITTQLKSKITFDQNVLAINYVVETVNGTVYLIGIAQNRSELQRVINHASAITHVKNVISHVRLKKKSYEAS